MKILDTEIEFDFFDADQVEKFEAEAKKVKEKSQNKEILNLSLSEALREECKMINEFFDNVFGNGTSEKIFKGKMNLQEHITAFADIVDEKIRQQKDLQDTLDKYSPNRVMRRTQND